MLRFIALAVLAGTALLTGVAGEAQAARLEPTCAVPQAKCCPQPCITYRHRGGKICCGCEVPIKTCITVCNPCTGCPVEIPVCLPGCCYGAPKKCSHRGLLGRDNVELEWCCGFSMTVRFKRNGDLIVITHGS